MQIKRGSKYSLATDVLRFPCLALRRKLQAAVGAGCCRHLLLLDLRPQHQVTEHRDLSPTLDEVRS